jgi:hypothetical protein
MNTRANYLAPLPVPEDRNVTPWRRSSWSATNGNCVEVARLGGGHVGVRDSKDPAQQVLAFSPGEWRSFLTAVRASRPRG